MFSMTALSTLAACYKAGANEWTRENAKLLTIFPPLASFFLFVLSSFFPFVHLGSPLLLWFCTLPLVIGSSLAGFALFVDNVIQEEKHLKTLELAQEPWRLSEANSSPLGTRIGPFN